MPNLGRNISKAAKYLTKGLSIKNPAILDDKGNPLTVSFNDGTPTDGVYRTYLNSNNPTNVMVKLEALDPNSKYPLGFTPEEAYYVNGTQSEPEKREKEQGIINVSDTSNKIYRTNLQNGQFEMTSNAQGNLDPKLASTYTNYNQGFTNPWFYITSTVSNPKTGLPSQLGDDPKDISPNYNNPNYISTTPLKMIQGDPNNDMPTGYNGSRGTHLAFRDLSQYSFIHKLDNSRNQISQIGESTSRDFDFAHFTEILYDNEDPVAFGYDLRINWLTSPLFNGSIISFINSFSQSIDDIENRRSVWVDFCNQFFKFFKLTQPTELKNYSVDFYNQNWDKISESATSSNIKSQKGEFTAPRSDLYYGTGEFGKRNKEGKTLPEVVVTSSVDGSNNPKIYYLKKISGLDNLVEKGVSVNSDKVKSMVDYGNDVIKLTLYEDTSINTGYLASLYKLLSWSRRNGRQVIPENLLRFNVDIIVTEIRDFERVVKSKDNKDLIAYADKTTKYIYHLYDCQFQFDNLSHGNDIDMTEKKFTDDFDIEFNYKFSTMDMWRFTYPGNVGTQSSLDLHIVDGKNGTSTTSNQPQYLSAFLSYSSRLKDKSESALDNADQKSSDDIMNSKKKKFDNFISSEAPTLEKVKKQSIGKQILKNLENKAKKAVVKEINRQITTQARLLNKAIDDIRNTVGGGILSKMSSPTNVYQQDQFKDDMRNAFRDFVGQSVRGFFSGDL